MKTKGAYYLIAFLIILSLNFLLPRLMAGDPLTAIYGEEVLIQMTPALKSHLVESFGIGQPLWEQFFRYLFSLLKGDMGYSFYRKTPVLKVILSYLPWTMLLMGTAFVFSIIVGIVLGIESGWRRGRRIDKALLVAMMSFSGFPSFFVGIIFLLIFGIKLGFFPFHGATTAYAGLSGMGLLWDILRHLVLPLSTLVVVFVSGDYLLTRSTMVTVVQEPFVLVAKAKGLTDRKIRYRHAGRNSLIPVVTATGVRFGSMIVSGALFVEIVFSYPGMGSLVYDALLTRDYPVLQGSLLVITIAVLMVNLMVDLLYRKLDPRTSSAQ
jgi:peptide/nickel transport system permease protein